MAVDVSAGGALKRRLDLQERLWKTAHTTVRGGPNYVSRKDLFRQIRSYLLKASDEKLIDDAPTDVRRKLLESPPQGGYFEIAVGTVRNFNRTKDLPHFTRRDGGWFDFQIQVREEGHLTEIVAYDFELRLPSEGPISFFRVDLNPPGHDTAMAGLRSHLHLNSDDDGLVAPAPVMSPFEILDLFVHGVVQQGRIRRRGT